MVVVVVVQWRGLASPPSLLPPSLVNSQQSADIHHNTNQSPVMSVLEKKKLEEANEHVR